MSLAEIHAKVGREGVTDYLPAYGREGAITDDTQMTLFTAEGLIRSHVRGETKGICFPPAIVHHAYLRWLITQSEQPDPTIAPVGAEDFPDGWLVKERALWGRRAPGNTCLTALATAVNLGHRVENDSKGCGTVMRVAPVGLLSAARGDRGTSPAYELGEEVSRLTHGHPAGYMAGAAFAVLIALLMAGLAMRAAVDAMLEVFGPIGGSGFVTRSIDVALNLVAQGGEATPEKVESLGGGWVAEEAFAIALYCALVARDYEHGVLLAVNHSGDSDSTGSLTGQLLGALWGEKAIPRRWAQKVELRSVIVQVARDLARVRSGTFDCEKEWSRYPGW
jgi:ADP-ribosylglycohydrolase